MHWKFYNLDHSNANPIIYRHRGFIIIWIPSFFLRWGKRTQGKLMLTQQIDMLTTQLTHILSWEGFIYGYHDMAYSWDEVLPSFKIAGNWQRSCKFFFPWNWLPFILSILFQSSIFKFNLFCLDLTLYNLKTTLILSPQLVIMSWKMLLNHWILYFPSPNSYEDYRIGLVIHSLPNLFRSFTWPDDIKYWRKASQMLCSWVTELAFSVNNSTYLPKRYSTVLGIHRTNLEPFRTFRVPLLLKTNNW